MSRRTDRQVLIEEALGRPLAPYLEEQRAAGTSWRRIALALGQETGHDITGEALRQWHTRDRLLEGSAA